MANIIKMFYDLETTGVELRKHSIHQIAGLIEINEKVVETFDIRTRPHPKAEITPKALKIGNVTEEQIMSYKPMNMAHLEFRELVAKYIDPYDRKDKMFLCGFNNRYFDDPFLRAWFEQNGDTYIYALFWPGSLDAIVHAAEYLQHRRHTMPSFKQKRVAIELGIQIDETKLHNAAYDVQLTRSIYRITTGREIEL